MREDIDIKKALIALGVFILMIIGLKFVMLYIAFGVDDFNDYTIKTKYGDEFKISFDSFKVQSMVTPVNGQNTQSYFCFVVKFKPSKDDFVGLKHTSELTVYKFGGDTIFKGSLGDTRYPGGKRSDLLRSIGEKIFSLPEDTVLYSGHSEKTTVGVEKRR